MHFFVIFLENWRILTANTECAEMQYLGYNYFKIDIGIYVFPTKWQDIALSRCNFALEKENTHMLHQKSHTLHKNSYTMAVSQYNKFIWLVDTIRSAGKITRAEIDRRWMCSSLNENHESRFPERSFFRCLNDIELLFDIEIKCQRSPYGGQYYIAKSDYKSQTKQ